MENVKISSLAEAVSLDASDVLVGNDGSVTKKFPGSLFATTAQIQDRIAGVANGLATLDANTLIAQQSGAPWLSFSPAMRSPNGSGVHSFVGARTNNNASYSSGVMTALPIFIPASGTLSSVAINCSISDTNASMRLGIYEDSNGRPSNLLVDAGLVSFATTGIKSVSINVAIKPGIVWAAALGVSNGDNGQARRISIYPYTGQASDHIRALSNSIYNGYLASGLGTASMPDPAPVGAGSGNSEAGVANMSIGLSES